MSRRYRTLLVLVALASLGAVSVGWLASRARLRVLEQAAVERVRAGTAVLASRIRTPGGEPDELQRLARDHASLLRIRVTLIGADGRVAADSAVPAEGLAALENHRDRPEVAQAALAGVGELVRRSSTTGVEYLYGARRIGDDDVVRFARLAMPWRPARQNARRHGLLAGVWSLVASLFVVGPAYVMLRRRERALRRFAEEIEHAESAGEARVRDVEADRALLASVIGGMRDGLLLVDDERRVRLANDALRANLAVDFDPHGRQVTEAVRHPAVIEEIDAALADGGERSDSIIRVASTDQAFRLHTVTLERAETGRREVLMLFIDITRLERLERVRREFVANVSHELRTPLTSIKAFVETLTEGGLDDHDEARRFLGIVGKHSDRMSELIDDLTDLSLIETGAIRLEIEAVDGARAAREIVGRLAPQIERRGLQLRIELPEPCPIWADRRRLEQVLTNLIDNAVKFCRSGGTIVVSGEQQARATVLRVRDDGIGIARDAQKKIFHRFHRERRAAGDDVRGTGLGLAIVKHLMRLHGGSVRVESELGQGAEFVVEFPTAPGA